jgi:hypothetical protein
MLGFFLPNSLTLVLQGEHRISKVTLHICLCKELALLVIKHQRNLPELIAMASPSGHLESSAGNPMEHRLQF